MFVCFLATCLYFAFTDELPELRLPLFDGQIPPRRKALPLYCIEMSYVQ